MLQAMEQCLPHAFNALLVLCIFRGRGLPDLVCSGLLAFASHYRDAACNEWDAGRVPGLKDEGLNGVMEHTGNTGLYVSSLFYSQFINQDLSICFVGYV
ncbi:hypothetical protein EDB82DRAFT_18885 [Fusarium venenatum]|uniref:uncharacterized protein n=1 Tax=Fusarium venenatum TaxID=56646 RepID=UPI001DD62E0C|nr:hypothetical protein EDB82DRAFT_18885 [Fusarium venenatum]